MELGLDAKAVVKDALLVRPFIGTEVGLVQVLGAIIVVGILTVTLEIVVIVVWSKKPNKSNTKARYLITALLH
jgi:hypothetical protein